MALVLLVLPLSGCQTSSIDDLGVSAPQALIPPEPAPVATTPPPTQTEFAATPAPGNSELATAVANSDEYPVIGRERAGETSQLTKADTDSIREELRRASENSPRRDDSSSPAQFESELEALRNKAKSHGQNALEKIEKPQG